MSDQVTFLGHLGREQVVEYLRDTDIFVLGSRYETFGVVVAEALAMGKPVTDLFQITLIKNLVVTKPV